MEAERVEALRTLQVYYLGFNATCWNHYIQVPLSTTCSQELIPEACSFKASSVAFRETKHNSRTAFVFLHKLPVRFVSIHHNQVLSLPTPPTLPESQGHSQMDRLGQEISNWSGDLSLRLQSHMLGQTLIIWYIQITSNYHMPITHAINNIVRDMSFWMG